ncbi:alpha/beta fold hydrolase [Paenibacillus illinoisensis]|uniref:alpha/beta hydrolase n=1 Tax=Paenibacillus illinoisensis TaxID=59845 RepID=UPI003CEE7B23
MNIIRSQSLTLRAGDQAVLLLHGFTGSTAEVRRLGRYLHDKGYTCHAPLYAGHGIEPQALLQVSPEQWWEEVLSAYDWLRSEGYTQIATVGISLGGLMALRMTMHLPVAGAVAMCAPAQPNTLAQLKERILAYGRSVGQLEGKMKAEIEKEVDQLQIPWERLEMIRQWILLAVRELHPIEVPLKIMQGRLDKELYVMSAFLLNDRFSLRKEDISWYEESGHILTLGPEREQVFSDVLNFLNSLTWR